MGYPICVRAKYAYGTEHLFNEVNESLPSCPLSILLTIFDMRLRLNVKAPLKDLRRHAKDASRLLNFLLIDIRVLFIIVSIYTTVASVISTTAHNEAIKDTTSERPFNVTNRPEHIDVIVQEVSNAILWDCRENSVTRSYYKSLYGLLFTSFGLIGTIFIGARLSVMCGWRSKLSHNLHHILWRLVLIKRLRQLVICYGANDPRTKEKAELYYEQWNSKQEETVHWTISAVPYFEALFLVLALPFMLTSYDLHPLGCVVGPDEDSIRYNNETGKVELSFHESLLLYRRFALGASIVLMVPIAIFASLLMWRYKTVSRTMGKEVDKIAGKNKMPEDAAAPSNLCNMVANTTVEEILKDVIQIEIPMEDFSKTFNANQYEASNELNDNEDDDNV